MALSYPGDCDAISIPSISIIGTCLVNVVILRCYTHVGDLTWDMSELVYFPNRNDGEPSLRRSHPFLAQTKLHR